MESDPPYLHKPGTFPGRARRPLFIGRQRWTSCLRSELIAFDPAFSGLVPIAKGMPVAPGLTVTWRRGLWTEFAGSTPRMIGILLTHWIGLVVGPPDRISAADIDDIDPRYRGPSGNKGLRPAPDAPWLEYQPTVTYPWGGVLSARITDTVYSDNAADPGGVLFEFRYRLLLA